MASICFNTPAFGRLQVSEIIFRQRRRALDALAQAGHEVQCVVVADDENLDLAAEHGFLTVQLDNRLGAKFNAGYQAAADWGADWIMPLGSDSLIDPALILHWIDRDYYPYEGLYTRMYSVIRKDGKRRLDCTVEFLGGGGMIMRRELLARAHFQPIEANRPKGCDGATLRSLASTKTRWHQSDLHQLCNVGLHTEQQLTSYALLAKRWGTTEVRHDPIGSLEPTYGLEVVRQVRKLYAGE